MEMTKQTKWCFIHCSDTYSHMDNIGEEDIRRWHRARGWDDIGYHVVIRRDGRMEFGRPFDVMGAHVQGYNDNSIGICLIGGRGLDEQQEDNFTPEQKKSLITVIYAIAMLFPGVKFLGHRDAPGVTKACPSFSVEDFLLSIHRHDLFGTPED